MTPERKEELAQSIRNLLYLISAVAVVLGWTIDENLYEPIVMGILALITLISSLVSWWYSRKKFTVKLASGEHVAS